jgi:hypothetical protein
VGRCGRAFADQKREITKVGNKRDYRVAKVLRKKDLDWGGPIFPLNTWGPREETPTNRLVPGGRGNIPPLQYFLFA